MAPTDDDAAEPADDPAAPASEPAPDPALSYPRGNRLGLRHPRPTVVIVVAVLLVLGGAFVWKAIVAPHEAKFCALTASLGSPTAPTPELAFQRWFDQTMTTTATATPGAPSAPSSVDDFTRTGDTWTYRSGNRGVEVVVGPGYAVTSANDCTWQPDP